MTEFRIRRKSMVATATVGTNTADALAMDCNAMVGGCGWLRVVSNAALGTSSTARVAFKG